MMFTRFFRCLLAFVLVNAVCVNPAHAANYGNLYVVGEFCNWNLSNSLVVAPDADGVYSLTMKSSEGTKFKMSFSGNADWNEFDRQSVGIGSESTWNPGIHKLVSQVANSHLPSGDWIITVYRKEMMVALSAPGEPVPIPGDVRLDSGTLPVLYINVYDENGNIDNEIIDYNLGHKNYFDGTYWLDMNGCEWLADEGAVSIGSKDDQLPLQIKARGNYTRTGFSKKPFKIKLDKKQSLLGLSKSKHFALMAHADDNYEFLRNFVGFNLGQRIGLPWTPRQQPVEVVINGDYRGLYMLTESIRIDSDRIDIVEGQDNDSRPEYVSGGYVVELDNYDEDYDSQIVLNEKSCVPGHNIDALRITFDTPEQYSELQRRFVTDQFTAMNDAVGACDDVLWQYMDMDDAARYYIVKELVSDTEAYHGSTYLFRDLGEGQKWHFSPLWDFGNAFNGSTTQYFYDNDPFGNTWIPSMRRNEKFNDKISETFLWFMSQCFDGIYDDIELFGSRIAKAVTLDLERWRTADIPQRSVSPRSAGNSGRLVREHIDAKARWLASTLGDYTTGTFPEPERDTTEAAPLPEYAQSGIENITVDAVTPESNRLYNLLGQPVNEPVRGSIYITSKGLIIY